MKSISGYIPFKNGVSHCMFMITSLVILDLAECNPNELCAVDNAFLASNTYLGNLQIDQELVWHISTSSLQYIVLTIDHFDISCTSATLFQMTSTTRGTRTICNMDKPLGQIVSLGVEMTVKFATNILPGALLEQFFGHYSVKGMIQTANDVHAHIDAGKKK